MERQPMTDTTLVQTEKVEKSEELVNTACSQESEPAKFCENCHARVDGAFCGQCGQSLESSLKYFWTVVLHLLDDIFSFDSRASRTVFPLFFRPGFLTNEYISGKRVHYVPPLRLYLFISIVFFLSLKFFTDSATSEFSNEHSAYTEYTKYMKVLQAKISDAPDNEKDALLAMRDKLQSLEIDLQVEKSSARYRIAKRALEVQLQRYKDDEPLSTDDLEELAELSEKLAKSRQGIIVKYNDPTFSIGTNDGDSIDIPFLSKETNEMLSKKSVEIEAKIEKQMAENPAKLMDYAIEKLPQLMFLLLPIFAVLLKIMYLFSKRLYMEHLTVALHSHSFIFFAILLIEILDVTHDAIDQSYPTLAEITTNLAMGILIWIPVYLFIMQKRVYKQGYIFTFIKYNIIGLIYILMIALTAVAAFIWGIVEA